MEFNVKKIDENIYQFDFENEKLRKIKILKNNNILIETKLKSFVIEHPIDEEFPLFEVYEDDNKYIIGERVLKISGMNNFRDLGGYITKDNKRVKWRKIFRSDHIYNADSEGIKSLKKLNINTIIDYRSKSEIAKYPNKIINCEKTFNFDPNAHTAELAAQFTSDKKNEDINLVNKIIAQKKEGKLLNQYDIVMKQYENFVTKKECQNAFYEMIKLHLDESNLNIVQHCRGGKDRTGFGSMLLLGILGVEKKNLVEDYMITYYNRIKRNNYKMDKYKKLTNDPVVLDYLLSLIDTKEEFISKSIDTIEKKYGSIENYAKDVLGITSQEIEKLKKIYLY